MLDGYENPDPTAKPPSWAGSERVQPARVRPLNPISERILEHIDGLESLGVTARHSSFVVIPSSGLWRKIGNKSFYRLFGLHYLNHSRKKNGLQEAIDTAKSRIFIKDGSYSVTTALTLQPGIALEGESMPQITSVDPTAPENITFTTNANGDTGTVLTTTGSNDCFTGNSLRTVSVTNLGLGGFNNGFNIGKANTLGIAKSHFARILFSAVTTPINVMNFQNLCLDQIYAWCPASTANFLLIQNNNTNWNGGNSYWTDIFGHGWKNVNGAMSFIAVAGYLNMIEAHRVQVNMQDANFVSSTSGYGIYMQGQAASALCQNNEFYAVDIEGGPLKSVRMEDYSYANYVHLAYSVHANNGFDFSLKKNATTQAPINNLLVFHSNTGGNNLLVESDNFNNFLLSSQVLNPVTGSYPSGMSGVGLASFGGTNFATMYGGGSGENFVGQATANIPGGNQTGPITITTSQIPTTQTAECGGQLNVTAYTSGTINVQATFSDQNSNAQTVTIPLMQGSNGQMLTGAAATGWYSFYLPLTTKPNTTITVKTTGVFTATYYCSAFIRATA